jgi:hypothetical protein
MIRHVACDVYSTEDRLHITSYDENKQNQAAQKGV